MADPGSLELRILPPFLDEDRAAIIAFLRERGLEPAGGDDYTACLLDAGRLVGVGSLSGRVVKGLAVDEATRGEGLAARLVSELEAEAARRGESRLLVFTKPEAVSVFASLGYRLLAQVEEAALLEKGDGLARWLAGIPPRPAGGCAALVMNCNPFTLGHLHLVKHAAERSASVLLFVVEEDASAFPFEVRLRLVSEGVAGIPGVLVVPGSDYLVSRATFPTYFLKEKGNAAAVHAALDVELFGGRIAPALGIRTRYVGEEPYCPTTALYNAAMKARLPRLGVGIVEIPRLESGGAAVSASTVRRLIREGRLAEARALVPASTWNYLVSREAAPVLARVAAAEGRH